MLQQFLNHVSAHQLCRSFDQVLLAVSGGIDSMVMFHLFLDAGYRPGVVHCNFGLRSESDAEEAFVSEACQRSGLKFFSHRFGTADYAHEHGLSIQVAARELRYAYFRDVMAKEGYNILATAHHATDNLETVLLNLTRGTGIDGVAGIPVRNGNIIRPLLFASRNAIEAYALANHVKWMDDASNFATDYSRNLIRHRVLPVLKEINPGLDETIPSTLHRLRGARYFTQRMIDDFSATAVKADGGDIVIDQAQLMAVKFPDVLLWEVIKEYGFGFDQCEKVIMPHQSGRRFSSATHELVVDRGRLFVHQLQTREEILVVIDQPKGVYEAKGCGLAFRMEPAGKSTITGERNVAHLDLKTLAFPLTWRTWKDGDYFFPLGMSGRKKVSDFLVDQKTPLHRKAAVTVVESAGKIVWVVGMRISEHAKITGSTTEILVITHQPSDDVNLD